MSWNLADFTVYVDEVEKVTDVVCKSCGTSVKWWYPITNNEENTNPQDIQINPEHLCPNKIDYENTDILEIIDT